MKNFESANDNGHRFEEMHNHPDVQRLNKLADHLEEITDDETLKREAQKFAESLGNLLSDHQSLIGKAYKKFRKGWDKLPHSAQWAMLKGEEAVPIAPSFFNHLVELGLLKYKGHASPEDRDEQLREKVEWDKKKTKWAVRIASIFEPEVAAVEPFLAPIEKLQNSKAKVFEIIRHHLDTLKIEVETEGKERKVMKKNPDADGEVPFADAA